MKSDTRSVSVRAKTSTLAHLQRCSAAATVVCAVLGAVLGGSLVHAAPRQPPLSTEAGLGIGSQNAPAAVQRTRVTVRVLDEQGRGIAGLPIVAERRDIGPASPQRCGWTDATGVASLDLDVRLMSEGRGRIVLRLASVAPACGESAGLGGGHEQPEYGADSVPHALHATWTDRVEVLMRANALPERVVAMVDAGQHDITVTMTAQPGVRVIGRVTHLRERVLFATPQRIDGYNPMWELFRLAERVPTDEIVLEGVRAPRAGEPVRIRVTSSSGLVSRLVEVTGEAQMRADGVREIDVGEVLLPQDIDRVAVDAQVVIGGGALPAGQGLAVTLCSKDYPGLLWHLDVMGGASAPTAKSGRDQRPYVPVGRFVVVPTAALQAEADFARFHDLVQAGTIDGPAAGLGACEVQPGVGGTLTLDVEAATARVEALLRPANQ